MFPLLLTKSYQLKSASLDLFTIGSVRLLLGSFMNVVIFLYSRREAPCQFHLEFGQYQYKLAFLIFIIEIPKEIRILFQRNLLKRNDIHFLLSLSAWHRNRLLEK